MQPVSTTFPSVTATKTDFAVSASTITEEEWDFIAAFKWKINALLVIID